MTGSIIIISFFVLMFVGIPVAVSLCLAALFYMTVFVDIPPIIIAQQMLAGIDKFTLMAVPFFVVAGSLMEFGGISKRIVNFAKALVGSLPGGMAIVTVISSMIFAAMTGAGAATTAAVGGTMIPAMTDENYDEDFRVRASGCRRNFRTADSSKHSDGFVCGYSGLVGRGHAA